MSFYKKKSILPPYFLPIQAISARILKREDVSSKVKEIFLTFRFYSLKISKWNWHSASAIFTALTEDFLSSFISLKVFPVVSISLTVRLYFNLFFLVIRRNVVNKSSVKYYYNWLTSNSFINIHTLFVREHNTIK